MNKHAVIIRFWHNDYDIFKWRLAYFQSMVLPRLQNQTVQDFDICLLSDPVWHDRLRGFDPRIRPFSMKTGKYDYKKQGNFKLEDTYGLDHYAIQTRIDSDDLVSPYFIEAVRTAHKKTPYITFQPELFILDELKIRKMKYQYRTDKPSAFLSVMNYGGVIYDRVFLRFNDKPCTLIPEGYCWVSIHNYHSGKTNRDI